MFKNPQANIKSGNQIIFSDFLDSVENGEVLKVEIQGNNIKGVFANGDRFSTYSPNDPNFIFPEETEIKNLLGFHGSYTADFFFNLSVLYLI